MNQKIKIDIEKAGGTLLGKSNGLISSWTFKRAGQTIGTCLELQKKFPRVDFYTRGRRLCVYGIENY